MEGQDQDQERTEQASPRRREEARKRGQVARSQEVGSAAILMACLIYFYFDSGGMLRRMMDLMKRTLREAGTTNLDGATVQAMLAGMMYESFLLVLPLMLTVIVAGLLANYVQVGFLITAESMKPELSKIDPIKGFKRLFSLKAFTELVKSILKICIIGAVVYWTVSGEMEDTLILQDQTSWGILVYLGEITFKIILRTFWVLVLLALFDYLYQRWEYERGLRMSRQEVKEEFRQTEGEPMVRSRIRQLQRAMAKKRMMASVPKADVVITNPEHLAVALRYDPSRMNAPFVVAKGADLVAEMIRAIARQNGIPVVENKPLAQVLFRTVKVDEAIPDKLYRVVAEILAYVYSLKEERRTA